MAGGYTGFKKKATGPTYEQIVRDVQAGNLKPIYYLMGQESYYIDHVADFIVNAVLKPEERDFNLMTFFGAEADIDNIITAAQAFPMAAKHLVIVVKEAQNLKHIEHLEYYLRKIQPSTILVFCHKNGTLDRRTKVATLINKEGVLFESAKLRDAQLPPFVRAYLQRKRVVPQAGVPELMSEYVGADLNRMASELDKLVLSLPDGEKQISIELVQRHIGISKNYNIFELQDAIGSKDVLKVNRIVKYFDENEKDNPIQRTLASLFKYFANLMVAFYAPNKTKQGIATWLGLTEWQVEKNVLPAMRSYSGVKVMQILAEIRRTDARSKGAEGSHTSNGDLMKELIYFILH